MDNVGDSGGGGQLQKPDWSWLEKILNGGLWAAGPRKEFGSLTYRLVHSEWFETYDMTHRKNVTFRLMCSEGV